MRLNSAVTRAPNSQPAPRGLTAQVSMSSGSLHIRSQKGPSCGISHTRSMVRTWVCLQVGPGLHCLGSLGVVTYAAVQSRKVAEHYSMPLGQGPWHDRQPTEEAWIWCNYVGPVSMGARRSCAARPDLIKRSEVW